MTLYNIEKLEALKLKYTSSIVGGELSNRGVMNKGLIITDFIEYLRERRTLLSTLTKVKYLL